MNIWTGMPCIRLNFEFILFGVKYVAINRHWFWFRTNFKRRSCVFCYIRTNFSYLLIYHHTLGIINFVMYIYIGIDVGRLNITAFPLSPPNENNIILWFVCRFSFSHFGLSRLDEIESMVWIEREANINKFVTWHEYL